MFGNRHFSWGSHRGYPRHTSDYNRNPGTNRRWDESDRDLDRPEMGQEYLDEDRGGWQKQDFQDRQFGFGHNTEFDRDFNRGQPRYGRGREDQSYAPSRGAGFRNFFHRDRDEGRRFDLDHPYGQERDHENERYLNREFRRSWGLGAGSSQGFSRAQEDYRTIRDRMGDRDFSEDQRSPEDYGSYDRSIYRRSRSPGFGYTEYQARDDRGVFDNDHYGVMGREGPEHHIGKGPKGYRRSDERIHEDVCEALARDPYIDASDIEVKIERGIVTLSGTVDSRLTKREAEYSVEGLPGVEDVRNELKVQKKSERGDENLGLGTGRAFGNDTTGGPTLQ